MIRQGEVLVRADMDAESYVLVLSGSMHLASGSARVITCPFIPGGLDDGVMALAVPTVSPTGVLLPELVHWLPRAALGESIGTVDDSALRHAVGIVAALVS